MAVRPPAQIVADVVNGRGRGAPLRAKLLANKETNWLLAVYLDAFKRASDGAEMSDLDKTIVDAFRQHNISDKQLKTYAQASEALSAPARAELFPGRFAQLDRVEPYSFADLRRDAPSLVRATLNMPNVADVDVGAVHAGTRSLREFAPVPRAVAARHGTALLRAVAPNAAPSTARYTIKAVRFVCRNESGVDFLGSDEPFWIFGSVGDDSTLTTQSGPFGDVDSGEQRTFPAGEGCIWGQNCQPQALPDGEIGTLVSLWEKDAGNTEEIRKHVAAAFAAAGPILAATGVAAWVSALVTGLAPVIAFLISLFDNDHLNDQTFVFTRQVLEDRLAKAGSSFDITRRFVGGSADYSLTIRVSRTA